MRSTAILAAAGALLTFAAGCGPAYCDPYSDPYCGYYYGPVDYLGVGVDPYGYCSDPISCGCLDPTVCLTKVEASPAACAAGDGTCVVRSLGTSVNRALQSALLPVDALLSASPSTQGDLAVYGPVDAAAPGATKGSAATFRLTVRRSSATTSWKLEAEPLDRSSGWATVFTGTMVPDAQSRRGRGVLGVDLDALATVNAAAYPGGGRLLGAFDGDGSQKATSYRLAGFRTGSAAATDGLLSSTTAADGSVRTVFSAPGAAPVQVTGSATPLVSGGASGGASAAPVSLHPGDPPTSMPDPGF